MQPTQDWQAIAEAQARGASQPDGHGCIANFYLRPVLDPERSAVEGRAVHDEVPYVKIMVAGQPRNIVDERVHETYAKPAEDPRLRFPRAWEAFQARRAGLASGTPIEQWPLLTVAQVADLKAAGILAIEQLAGMSDDGLPRLGLGGRELRERARQFLRPAPEVEQELRRRIRELEGENADLKSRVEQLVTAQGEAGEKKPRKAA